MDIFSAFATDEIAESAGRSFPLDKTTSVTVARTGNPNYVKALRRRMEESQVDVTDTSDANELLVGGMIIDAMAEGILLGWSGVQYKGKDLPYSKDNARMLLGIKDFRERISSIAGKQESFRIKEEVEQGNA